jgi:hypothetical protein
VAAVRAFRVPPWGDREPDVLLSPALLYHEAAGERALVKTSELECFLFSSSKLNVC